MRHFIKTFINILLHALNMTNNRIRKIRKTLINPIRYAKPKQRFFFEDWSFELSQ